MVTVKKYLEQYDWFKGGKKLTPILVGRYEETRKQTDEEREQEKKSDSPVADLFADADVIVAFNTLFYLVTEEDELIRVLVSNSLENRRNSYCEVEKLEKFKLKEIGKLSSLYVFDDERTKPINANTIQKMLPTLDNSCSEVLKPLYSIKDIFEQPFWNKYAED